MEFPQWDSAIDHVTDHLNVSSGAKPRDPKLTTLVSRSQLPVYPDPNAPILEAEQRNIVPVSTTFFPGFTFDHLPSDVALLTSDSVFFYAHSHRLLAASDNGFNAMLPQGHMDELDGNPPLLFVPENSAVLNVILHTIYNMSTAQFLPATRTVVDAVDAMTTYGIPAKTYIGPSTPLFLHLLTIAVIHPIEIYALAGSLDIFELAVGASAHLLSYSLPSLTDELAVKMGPIYLRRLVFLHLGRLEALKRHLLPPPPFHRHTTICGAAEQSALSRAWTLASAYLTWDARPDLSTVSMGAALYPLENDLHCEECKRLLRERIGDLVMNWALVKKTI
ncbi:hypothetical protein DENSPDRAFT_837701 [Dentipellis sp. KUC8613]|nr:hypothetical protein DENSPDRAFT_837701 [Dentipellis sp. KUC8613]